MITKVVVGCIPLSLLSRSLTILISQFIGISDISFADFEYKFLPLLTTLITTESENDDISLVPIPKMNMILKLLENIFDGDLAFDDRFVICRLMIMRFIRTLLSQNQFTEIWSTATRLAERLVADGYSMCLLEDTLFSFELGYETFELDRRGQELESWNKTGEYTMEILDGFSEMIFRNDKDFHNNSVTHIYFCSLTTVFNKLRTIEQINLFPKLMAAFTSQDWSKNINLSRFLVSILSSLITSKQQTNLIEFELKKMKTKANSTDNDDDNGHEDYEEFKVPQNLIDILSERAPKEYLEYENQFSFLGYLWSWYLTLTYFKDVSYNMRELYIEQLKERDMINGILDFIVDQIDFDDVNYWKTVKLDDISNYDINSGLNSMYVDHVNDECKILLVHLMYKIFNISGTMSAQWFLNVRNKSLASRINEFVSRFISPILIENELKEVEGKIEELTAKDDSLSIKINKKTNEVKASFLIDEQKLEILFKLPENYPLSNIQVVGVSRVGISEQKWKQWIMSTQHVITGMNGSVQDSLELFTKNVNLQFSGFEECAICYSILHAVDRKLPSKTCPTCNNKFHGACLYKWFRSSGNNTCPLCRGEISFRR